MTTIAMMTLTQLGATLLAIITAAILAATASVVATPPDSTHGRRCFRATMAAGSAEVIMAVDSILKYAGAPISACKQCCREFEFAAAAQWLAATGWRGSPQKF